jgi:hypothetical protein
LSPTPHRGRIPIDDLDADNALLVVRKFVLWAEATKP